MARSRSSLSLARTSSFTVIALVQLCRRNHVPILLVCSIFFLVLGTYQNSQRVKFESNTRRNHLPARSHLLMEPFYQDPNNEMSIKACPLLPEELGLVGQIPVNLTAPTWSELHDMFPEVEEGGRWRPSDCVATSRVAIVIPYRNRDYNLRAFLQHMHAFLRRQKLDYGIIVAEQAGNTTFNRGLMRNIGFQEANLYGEYDCTVFNDVDLLPENDMNTYGCSDMPRHMCIALNYFNYTPIASGAVFGGVVSFRNDHFRRANGYSNLYFGWGGEDDDIMTRCRKNGVGYYRARPQYGRYTGTPHAKDHRIRTTYKLWRWREKRLSTDGLNTLKYKVIKSEKRQLYTWVLAEVDENGYQTIAKSFLSEMDKLALQATTTPSQNNDGIVDKRKKKRQKKRKKD